MLATLNRDEISVLRFSYHFSKLFCHKLFKIIERYLYSKILNEKLIIN
jgi:hypothetical protein